MYEERKVSDDRLNRRNDKHTYDDVSLLMNCTYLGCVHHGEHLKVEILHLEY